MLNRKDDELIPAVIYYEGNLYGAENLNTYEERIRCATGRAFTKYPTVAFTGVIKENLKEFIVVGFCSPEEQYRIVFSMGSGPIIKEWLS